MRIPAALPVVVTIGLSIGAAHVYGQEPRLPPPAATPSESEALIQRALALTAAGSHREGAATWQTVGAREPVLAALAARESVRALIAAGDIEPALKGINELGAAASADLLLRAADACRAAAAYDCATSTYRRARDSAGKTPAADAAAIGLAVALEQAGQARDALETYRELQLTFREVSAFEIADAGARRLSARLNNPEPLNEADYGAIVDRLAGVAAFRRAVDLQAEWLNTFPSTSRREEIESTRVEYLYSARANDDARFHAHTFLKEHPDSEHAHDVFIILFRLDVREGRTTDVETRGRAIMSGSIAGTTLSDRQGAGRLLAEYLVSVGQPAKALGVYSGLYKITLTRTSRADVLWRMAIASLRAGNPARAVKELQQVLRLKVDSETERAATFWLGYAQDAAGATTAARAQWASLAQRYPFSYYGTRAAERTGTPSTAASLTFPELTVRPAVIAHPDYEAAALLSRAGMLSDAAIYARRLNAAFRRDDAVALLAARASEAAGDYSSSSTLMSSYFGPFLQQPATNLPSDFWALAYPRAYWTDVSAAAARHGVDPLLMIGLARQESHFNRMARSPVGAVGLFQVMPYTAVELDPQFSSPTAMDRLVEPAVSAELAAKLIASLQPRFQGALAPTIASYNADKERVQVWWDAAKGLPQELFIDSIPYQQTRAYVRQVLTNYAMYQRSAQSASPRK
ncbi:MAG TPA: lytic transglycosylase domain-containing protein [Vicinamibacterales bacterium]|nr:lytic transglycosylase domain-containing protein [Vicinamibacterales bacterium]